jgi:hypothetical protein
MEEKFPTKYQVELAFMRYNKVTKIKYETEKFSIDEVFDELYGSIHLENTRYINVNITRRNKDGTLS